MGLMRVAAVVAVGVALMPADQEQQKRLIQRASDASTWAMTFCERNAETCAKRDELWVLFVAKAEFAAKLAYDTWRKSGDGDDGEAATSPASFETRRGNRLDARGGTLTPDDLRPAWRGPAKQRGSI